MKNIRLFPKTFIHCLCLMVGIIVIAFFLIYSFLPSFYREYKQWEIDSDTAQLAGQLQAVSAQDLASYISAFALQRDYGYHAAYENGDVICSAGTGLSFEFVGVDTKADSEFVSFDFDTAESSVSFYTKDNKQIILSMSISLQPIDDAVSVFMLLLPLVLAFSILLSAVASWFYAKTIVKPIQNITNATVEMQSLVPSVSCNSARNDEIGVLSRNINATYQKLLSAISELEQRIEEVSKAEQEKLDFLLLASHELKTPVTAVRGMVDGMLYNVGVYKDRDTYLKECQKALENLTELLCRILETSKMDAAMAAKSKEDTNIGKLLHETAEPYFIVAQSKGINMSLSMENNFRAFISAELIGKVFSNILSNAVKYTDSEKKIKIYMEDRSVVIENECNPLQKEELSHIGTPFYHLSGKKQDGSDSTGLGLYFTHRILSVCGMDYSFVPYESGMRFTLYF